MVVREQQRAALAIAAVVVAALAAAVVILPSRLAPVVVPVPPFAAAAAPDPGSARALATWITTETDVTAMIEAPGDVGPQLVREGVPAGRLGVPGALVVTRGTTGPGVPVARFGTGSAALTVTRPGAPVDDRVAQAARAGFGAQLAANPAIVAPAEVRGLLAGGGVDPRALLLLAGMTSMGPVEVVALPVAPSEDAGLPRHHLALTGLDAIHLDWLRAQRAPLAPALVVEGDRATLSWPVPAPPGLIGS